MESISELLFNQSQKVQIESKGRMINMKCRRCSGSNVNVISEQVGSKGRVNNIGILIKLGRLMLIFCTFGLWLIVGGRKERTHTKFKHRTMALCQNCGYKWKV